MLSLFVPIMFQIRVPVPYLDFTTLKLCCFFHKVGIASAFAEFFCQKRPSLHLRGVIWKLQTYNAVAVSSVFSSSNLSCNTICWVGQSPKNCVHLFPFSCCCCRLVSISRLLQTKTPICPVFTHKCCAISSQLLSLRLIFLIQLFMDPQYQTIIEGMFFCIFLISYYREMPCPVTVRSGITSKNYEDVIGEIESIW